MEIEHLFRELAIDEKIYQSILSIQDPEKMYVIAITPRSGSSYLCDLMNKSGLLGSPGEFLPAIFMKKILSNIPAKDSDEYLRHVMKKTQSKNGVSGLKTSWFQFREFYKTIKDPSSLNQFKYVYLYRRDVAQQAVSLYKATETSMFHTNIEHSADTLNKVKNIKYDFGKIDKWKSHIEAQELGWQNFFQENKIYPLRISYEEIDANAHGCVKAIANYLDVTLPSDYTFSATVFEKLRDRKSLEYACQFMLEFFDKQSNT